MGFLTDTGGALVGDVVDGLAEIMALLLRMLLQLSRSTYDPNTLLERRICVTTRVGTRRLHLRERRPGGQDGHNRGPSGEGVYGVWCCAARNGSRRRGNDRL